MVQTPTTIDITSSIKKPTLKVIFLENKSMEEITEVFEGINVEENDIVYIYPLYDCDVEDVPDFTEMNLNSVNQSNVVRTCNGYWHSDIQALREYYKNWFLVYIKDYDEILFEVI